MLVTKFIIRVTKFVIHVTNFVTKTFCQIVKIVCAKRENYRAERKIFLGARATYLDTSHAHIGYLERSAVKTCRKLYPPRTASIGNIVLLLKFY